MSTQSTLCQPLPKAPVLHPIAASGIRTCQHTCILAHTIAAGGTRTLNTKNIMIATGSEVTPMQGVPIDEVK